MRHVTYTCDRCGKTIKELPWTVLVTQFMHTPLEDPEDANLDDPFDLGERDFCEDCVKKVADMLEGEEEAAPEETKKSNQSTLDDGKIGALRDAGWTLKQIGEELHCSVQTVANHLKAMGRD